MTTKILGEDIQTAKTKLNRKLNETEKCGSAQFEEILKN